MLSKKSTDEISRYERGIYPPNLKTALKLEIIYQMPLRLLFAELFEELLQEVNEARRKHPQLLPQAGWFPKPAEQLRQEEFCFYAELLKTRIPNELEIRTVIKHIIALSNITSDLRQGRKPFENDQSAESGSTP